ncbi:MAG: dihydroorotate dehydrogenase electron transfer subunit, partial [Lachnospiraceae bacterium]|nr:dihydroorotate dehydrogenase electron transfer subunit [Lachnospiraceae bacterium]
LFLKEEFEKYCPVLVATEDGSRGIKGNVLDAVRAAGISPDVICACGPSPMLRAVKAYAEEAGTLCFISLEERMACGVGACLGCVAPTTKKDDHSHVNNTRVCTEGPVFDAEYIAL